MEKSKLCAAAALLTLDNNAVFGKRGFLLALAGQDALPASQFTVQSISAARKKNLHCHGHW